MQDLIELIVSKLQSIGFIVKITHNNELIVSNHTFLKSYGKNICQISFCKDNILIVSRDIIHIDYTDLDINDLIGIVVNDNLTYRRI